MNRKKKTPAGSGAPEGARQQGSNRIVRPAITRTAPELAMADGCLTESTRSHMLEALLLEALLA